MHIIWEFHNLEILRYCRSDKFNDKGSRIQAGDPDEVVSPESANTDGSMRRSVKLGGQAKRDPWRKLSDEEAHQYTEKIRENMRKRLGKEGHYYYQMIGECYLHGMMDGEAMLCQNEGDGKVSFPSVVFEIR